MKYVKDIIIRIDQGRKSIDAWISDAFFGKLVRHVRSRRYFLGFCAGVWTVPGWGVVLDMDRNFCCTQDCKVVATDVNSRGDRLVALSGASIDGDLSCFMLQRRWPHSPQIIAAFSGDAAEFEQKWVDDDHARLTVRGTSSMDLYSRFDQFENFDTLDGVGMDLELPDDSDPNRRTPPAE